MKTELHHMIDAAIWCLNHNSEDIAMLYMESALNILTKPEHLVLGHITAKRIK